MIATLLLLVAWVSAFLGAALIALANPAHRHGVGDASTASSGRRGSATCGSLLLVLTIVLAVLRDGPGMGMLLGPLLIATGIATVIAVLAIRPGSLQFLWALASVKRIDRQPRDD